MQDGQYPRASLALNGSTLYGTTQFGGTTPPSVPDGWGTVFKLKMDGTGFGLLHSFSGVPGDGRFPFTSLTLDGARLYGTTESGGASDMGTVFSLTDPFAFTRFDDPPLGAVNYSPGASDAELGFATTQSPTGGANPFVGVAVVETQRVLSHRSIRATTTLDVVDLDKWTAVEVSADVQISDTTFEAGDFVRIYITDGNQIIDLFDQQGAQLNNLAGDGFLPFAATIPDNWSNARLVIESSSNSSQAAERYDFDNIFFTGVPVPIPEPSSLVLSAVPVSLLAAPTPLPPSPIEKSVVGVDHASRDGRCE